jgi:galactitol-specific phosphotransferase system IIC component
MLSHCDGAERHVKKQQKQVEIHTQKNILPFGTLASIGLVLIVKIKWEDLGPIPMRTELIRVAICGVVAWATVLVVAAAAAEHRTINRA